MVYLYLLQKHAANKDKSNEYLFIDHSKAVYNFGIINCVIENIYVEIHLYKNKIQQKKEKLSLIQFVAKRYFREKMYHKRLNLTTKQNYYVTQTWCLLTRQCEQECEWHDSKKRIKNQISVQG